MTVRELLERLQAPGVDPEMPVMICTEMTPPTVPQLLPAGRAEDLKTVTRCKAGSIPAYGEWITRYALIGEPRSKELKTDAVLLDWRD
jgi:hypothetical protein